MEVAFGEDLKMILILVNGNLVNLMDMEFTRGLMVLITFMKISYKNVVNIIMNFRR